MSVPAFIDITEEDQASELRAYLKSKGAEISEENSEGGLHVDLAQIIEACDVCLKDDDKGVTEPTFMRDLNHSHCCSKVWDQEDLDFFFKDVSSWLHLFKKRQKKKKQ
uniref:Uncharacterized protein n=1 Tax=Cyprinus carpio TaxID=7962 RepID=A0A8C2FG38_CYPCA